MKLPPRIRSAAPPRSRGFLLLEALVATLVVALATLGFLGLAAVAIAGAAHARWRAEAAELAASTIARMTLAPPATLAADYDSSRDGAGYRELAALATRLPGVSATVNRPEIVVTPRTGGAAATASVRLRWQAPGESTPRRYAIEDAVIAP